MPGLLLSPDELESLTNGLTRPAAQLRALHRLGFTRASRPRGGPVVLTRVHYEAVETARPVDAAAVREQNAPSGPNVVGLEQWSASRRKHGTQAQRR